MSSGNPSNPQIPCFRPRHVLRARLEQPIAAYGALADNGCAMEHMGMGGMKKWLGLVAAAMALQAGTPAAQAARTAATMDVSFRIVESCEIRTGAGASAQDAEVRCQYQTPYQLQSGAHQAAPAAGASRTERPLDTDAPAALTIWF